MNKVRAMVVGSLAIVLCLIVLACNKVDTAAKAKEPSVAELQAQVVALQAQVAELKRFADETVPLVVGSMKRIDEISANHNRLIDAIGKINNDQNYKIDRVCRALSNHFGKNGKVWQEMMATAMRNIIEDGMTPEEIQARRRAGISK